VGRNRVRFGVDCHDAVLGERRQRGEAELLQQLLELVRREAGGDAVVRRILGDAHPQVGRLEPLQRVGQRRDRAARHLGVEVLGERAEHRRLDHAAAARQRLPLPLVAVAAHDDRRRLAVELRAAGAADHLQHVERRVGHVLAEHVLPAHRRLDHDEVRRQVDALRQRARGAEHENVARREALLDGAAVGGGEAGAVEADAVHDARRQRLVAELGGGGGEARALRRRRDERARRHGRLHVFDELLRRLLGHVARGAEDQRRAVARVLAHHLEQAVVEVAVEQEVVLAVVVREALDVDLHRAVLVAEHERGVRRRAQPLRDVADVGNRRRERENAQLGERRVGEFGQRAERRHARDARLGAWRRARRAAGAPRRSENRPNSRSAALWSRHLRVTESIFSGVANTRSTLRSDTPPHSSSPPSLVSSHIVRCGNLAFQSFMRSWHSALSGAR
jgi:hypothetical protein